MNFSVRLSPPKIFQGAFSLLFLIVGSLFLFNLFASRSLADDPVIAIGKCWSVNGPEGGVFAMDGDRRSVFAAGYDGTVSGFDAETGMLIWSAELGGEVVSNISSEREYIYVATKNVGASSATLRSLSRETGVTIWSVNIPAAKRIFLGGDGADVVYINEQLTLGRHLAENGELLWQRSFTGATLETEPQFTAGNVFFGTSAKRVAAVDMRTGAEELNFETSFVPTFVSASADQAIIWGGERGNIVKMTNDAEDTSWRFKAGARVVDAVKIGKTLVAASHDNFVYSISAYNGDVVWKRRMPGRILTFTVMDDDLAVVTVVGESTGYLIDLSNGRLHDRFPVGGANVMPLPPLRLGERDLVVASNTVLARYSIGGCTKQVDKKTAG